MFCNIFSILFDKRIWGLGCWEPYAAGQQHLSMVPLDTIVNQLSLKV